MDEFTPPTLFTVAVLVTFTVPLNNGLVYATSPVVDIVLAVVNPLAVPLKVPVITPAAKPPIPSLLTIVFAIFDDVAAFNVDSILVILFVCEATVEFKEVMLAEALFILVLKVVIVDELTPPTLFTVGNAAVPPKSPANCTIPFAFVVASIADIVPDPIVIPNPAVNDPCFALKDV